MCPRVLLRSVQIFSCDVRYFMMKMTMYKYLTNNKHIKHIKHYVRNCRYLALSKLTKKMKLFSFMNKNIIIMTMIIIMSSTSSQLSLMVIHLQHRGLVPLVPDEQEHEQTLLRRVPRPPLPQGLCSLLKTNKENGNTE